MLRWVVFVTAIAASKIHILTPIGTMGFRQSAPRVLAEPMPDVTAEDADGPAVRLSVTDRAD